MTEKAHESENHETPKFQPVDNSKDGAYLLAGDHLESMPAPQEHAIAAEQEDQEKVQGLVDKSGTPFDPDIHATDDNGEPLKTRAGNWRKKPGRKGGSTAKSTLNTKGGGNATAQNSGQVGGVDQNTYISAMTTVDTIGLLAQTLGGENYRYQVVYDESGKNVLVDERQNGIESFTRLYEQKGVKDIPPGAAVVLWGLMFLAPRLRQDNRAKNKIKLAWHWFLSKVSRKKRLEKKGEKESKNEGK